MIDNSEQLKRIRKERGLTIQAVCDGADIPIRTYQNYEYGKREISAEVLYKLAKFYGVTTDYLLGLEPPPPPADAMEVLGIEKNVDDDEFMRLYNELPDYAKQIFVDTMARLSRAADREKPKQRHVEHLGDIESKPKQEEQQETKPAITKIEGQQMAVARTSDPEKLYRPLPTEEQMASFTPVTPDMLGE